MEIEERKEEKKGAPKYIEDKNFTSLYVLQSRFDMPKYYRMEQPVGKGEEKQEKRAKEAEDMEWW